MRAHMPDKWVNTRDPQHARMLHTSRIGKAQHTAAPPLSEHRRKSVGPD